MKKTTSALTILVAALIVVGLGYLGRSASTNSTSAPRVQAGPIPVLDLSLPASSVDASRRAEIDRLIGEFETRVTQHTTPFDYKFLGQLYNEKARLTSDVSLYAKAATSLDRSLELYPSEVEARTLRATVALALHDFHTAAHIAHELSAESRTPDVVVVSGDAALALGDYQGAEDDFDFLASAYPDHPATLVRLAQLAFLRGDTARSLDLASDAVAVAEGNGARGRALAWYQAYLSEMAHQAGDYTLSSESARAALASSPDWAAAIAAVAKSEAALDNIPTAIAHYEAATEIVPEPSWLAQLGDLYELIGDTDTAQARYDTVATIAVLASQDSAVYDRQWVTFLADHQLEPKNAVSLAEAELESRQDIYAFDTLAWALANDGRFVEAREASDRALSMGTRDARLWFHAGMISVGLGDTARAASELQTALDISPRFDPIQSRIAEATLASLGS